MKRTLFSTPLLTPMVRMLSRAVLALFGWQTVGRRYSHMQKYVGVAAPHTSNWDFVIFLLTAFALDINAHWIGKHTLFRFPFHGVMTWLGGIPVNRSVRGDVVAKVSRMFRENSTFAIGVAPEGTRRPTTHWHTGFWYIAKEANVPILLAFIDYKSKRCGIDSVFQTSDDVDADMREIKRFYTKFEGRNPNNFRI